MLKEGYGRLVVAYIVAATTVGLVWAAVNHHRRKNLKPSKTELTLIPRADLTGSGGVGRLESFPQYFARQIGLSEGEEWGEIRKLASEYVRNSKGCEENIYMYFCEKEGGESLCNKMIDELERCILGYFAFHWNQATLMINQVLSVGSDQKRLKNIVMEATRKQRFERVTKDLKVTRTFSTLVEELKVIRPNNTPKGGGGGDESFTAVMEAVAHSDRSPILLFMGGGMGAGKSTVLKQILKQSFWSEAAENAVVVEADAFKETDVIYRALSSKGHHHDMLQTAELVHQTSTDAASSLLVTALNEGRDVIMDGTLSWEPFVEQTITMARNVHKYRYRMGVGYKVSEDGTITENYWEKIDDEQDDNIIKKKPYKIELVGVVCDAYLAIVRGIRRAIAVKRAVRINSQLKSHERFANAFPKYCKLVDNARLYCTDAIGVPPKLIGWKDGDSNLLIDPEEIKCLEIVSEINDQADSIYELYANPNTLLDPRSVWSQLVLLPTRQDIQRELKIAIEKIEMSKSSKSFY